jgi:hypothetical protein
VYDITGGDEPTELAGGVHDGYGVDARVVHEFGDLAQRRVREYAGGSVAQQPLDRSCLECARAQVPCLDQIAVVKNPDAVIPTHHDSVPNVAAVHDGPGV